MKPEDVFKIKDSDPTAVQPNSTDIPPKKDEPEVERGEEVVSEKTLTLEDVMDFLKRKEIEASPEVVRENFEKIVDAKTQKEPITNVLNEYNTQIKNISETIKENGNNSEVLERIGKLESNLVDLNTKEREYDDEIKSSIMNITNNFIENKDLRNLSKEEVNNFETKIFNVSNELLQIINESKLQLQSEELAKPTEKEPSDKSDELVTKEDVIVNEGEVEDVKVKESGKNEEKITEIETKKTPEESDRGVDDISNLSVTDVDDTKNKLENAMSSSKIGDETSEAILKEALQTKEAIDKLTKIISGGFESLGENITAIKNAPADQESREMFEGKLIANENVNVSRNKKIQDNYLTEYRESLRGKQGLKSSIGIPTELRGDNLRSFV